MLQYGTVQYLMICSYAASRGELLLIYIRVLYSYEYCRQSDEYPMYPM